jgi:hypothetical protein
MLVLRMSVLRRRWWVWAGAAVVVLAVVVTVLVWPSEPAPPRARPYLEYTTCLLTDGQGLAGPTAASVWTGMQDMSLATHVKVQYLQVTGEATVGNALPYLASLVQRQCKAVVAVGPAQVAAVAADAAKYPGVRFIVVDGHASGKNVTEVNGLSGTQLRDRVNALLTEVVHSAGL